MVEAFNEFDATKSNFITVTVQLPKELPGNFSLEVEADDPDPDGNIRLSWTESLEADNYTVIMRFWNTITWTTVEYVSGLQVRWLMINGLEYGRYYFHVVALNQYGNATTNEVDVFVNSPEPPGDGGIPGYDLIVLIGMVSTISFVVVYKFKKRRTDI